jgi:hypothetical protein
MNIPKHPADFNDAEWLAQERARLSTGVDAFDLDERDLRVSRALRQAPVMALPPGFAARVAGLVRMQAATDLRFEQRLLRGLSVAFGLSAIATVAWFGRSWPADFAAALPGGTEAVGWSVTFVACALCNFGLGLLRRRQSGDSSAHR